MGGAYSGVEHAEIGRSDVEFSDEVAYRSFVLPSILLFLHHGCQSAHLPAFDPIHGIRYLPYQGERPLLYTSLLI